MRSIKTSTGIDWSGTARNLCVAAETPSSATPTAVSPIVVADGLSELPTVYRGCIVGSIFIPFFNALVTRTRTLELSESINSVV